MMALEPAADELVAAAAALEAAEAALDATEAAEETCDEACVIAEVTWAPIELVTDATAEDYSRSACIAVSVDRSLRAHDALTIDEAAPSGLGAVGKAVPLPLQRVSSDQVL